MKTSYKRRDTLNPFLLLTFPVQLHLSSNKSLYKYGTHSSVQFGEELWGLEWLSRKESLLLLQRTGLHSAATGQRLTAAALGDLASSGISRTSAHPQTHTYTLNNKNNNNNKSFKMCLDMQITEKQITNHSVFADTVKYQSSPQNPLTSFLVVLPLVRLCLLQSHVKGKTLKASKG